MRPVVMAFSANDREKNDTTNVLNELYDATEGDRKKIGYSARHVIEIPRGTLAWEYFNSSCAD